MSVEKSFWGGFENQNSTLRESKIGVTFHYATQDSFSVKSSEGLISSVVCGEYTLAFGLGRHNSNAISAQVSHGPRVLTCKPGVLTS